MNQAHKIIAAVTMLFLAITIALAAGIASLVLISKVDRVSQNNSDSVDRVAAITEELVRLRKENNEATCVATNVSRASIRDTVKDSLLALVPPGTALTADQQLRIDAYNERVDRGLPFRDCSPEGIEAYLSNQPPDPAVPHG